MIIESRALKYGYSNARISYMKASLLPFSFFIELVKAPGVASIIEMLQRSSYRGEFAPLATKYSGSKLIEVAAQKSLAKDIEKLIRICPKADLDALRSFLLRYDVLNIKTVLRSKSIGKSFDEIAENIFVTPNLSLSDLRQIYTKGILSIKKTPISFIFEDNDILNASKKSVEEFYDVLDTHSFNIVIQKLSKINGVNKIIETLKREVDEKNIILIERMKSENRKGPLYIGGHMPDFIYSKLWKTTSIEETLSVIKSHFNVSAEDILSLEIELEKQIAKEKINSFYRSTLSFGALLGYLLIKEAEVENLKKIALGKEYGLSDEEIERTLVLV